ncbi:hypothetical protein Gotri_004248 [Gossypium trilobum]|uniref:Uncharacterized protein n=1 Tax=Gossypium trilobum TaxID=34281 RepID=A0A7J9F4K9_9ROSI|nr:hypothetical protein [Gossypium trilobum]
MECTKSAKGTRSAGPCLLFSFYELIMIFVYLLLPLLVDRKLLMGLKTFLAYYGAWS